MSHMSTDVFVCRGHNPVLVSSFIIYLMIVIKSNRKDATSEVGTANPSGEPEFSLGVFMEFVLFNL